MKPYLSRRVLEEGSCTRGTIQNKPVALFKHVVLYKQKQSFIGNSSFQSEGKIQREILK